MRVLVRLLATAVLAAGPALAASEAILYATASSEHRIDGFRINCQGGLDESPLPANTFETGGRNPRRLLVAQIGAGKVLYVAERDRVEALEIGEHGALRRVGRTTVQPNMDPRDMAVSPDGTRLYVTQRGLQRVGAYPLGPDGAPTGDISSCVLGSRSIGFQHVRAQNGLLYVTAEGYPGRISVYQLDATGDILSLQTDDDPATPDTFIPATPALCRPLDENNNRPPDTGPVSERRKLNGPKSFLIADGILYVEERDVGRISSFRLLPDGNFEPPTQSGDKRKFQKRESRTNVTVPYEQIVLHGRTLFGSYFGRGRIDAFRLRDDGRLPGKRSAHTDEDVRMTPVGITTSLEANVLYVGSGSFDRVVAYRLSSEGALRDQEPFDETDDENNSFPNDVAIAMLSAVCTQ
jgi:6-phosphogluconolactonase (cycloisomerase 2 family)